LPLYHAAYPSNTWRLHGVGFDFPTDVQIAPYGLLLLVGSDPVAFRAKYAVPSDVPIFGPYPGKLQGGGESLAIQRPDAPDLDTNTGSLFVPYIDVDVVRYDDKAPWPTNADGLGPSLERLNAAAYGNDPINWRASVGGPSPGLENTGNSAPVVNAGPDLSLIATNAPIAVQLSGAASDDGQPNPPGALALSWNQVSGPGQVWFSAPNQAITVAYFPGPGTYLLRLTASDSALSASDDLTVTVNSPVQPPVRIDSVGVSAGAPPLLHLRFAAAAGQTYTVQFRGSLTNGTWSKLTDVPAQTSAQTVEITDPILPASTQRFYRIVSPQQP